MLCEFILKDGICQCKTCGLQIKTGSCNIKRECVKKEYPSVLEMTTNLVKSVVNHTKNSFKMVTEEEKTRRLEICSGNKDKGIQPCEFYDNGRCKECGCFLPIKAGMESEQCRLGKWKKE
jgi:hypothetical protein